MGVMKWSKMEGLKVVWRVHGMLGRHMVAMVVVMLSVFVHYRCTICTVTCCARKQGIVVMKANIWVMLQLVEVWNRRLRLRLPQINSSNYSKSSLSKDKKHVVVVLNTLAWQMVEQQWQAQMRLV